jgi:cobyrinic acid a,c-diamide synthase
VLIVGVILNNVASARHEAMLRDALIPLGVDVFGVIHRVDGLSVPERHLGLVQAIEHSALETFIENAATIVERGCDLSRLIAAADGLGQPPAVVASDTLPPPGQRVAVARDRAFAFCYEHVLSGWRRQGAEVGFFSPLEDEEPTRDCDAIYLPGGYPELHAERLASAVSFQSGMKRHAATGTVIYGECGGYMVLGDELIDEGGTAHRMLELLPLTTSFAERRLHLGYRRIRPVGDFFCGRPMKGHEFHYATTVSEAEECKLFEIDDATGKHLGSAGLRRGSVSGSFMHVIDLAANDA